MEGVALVTGGAGFVGANVVRRLVREGVDVHVMLHRDVAPWRLAGLARITTHQCSVTDANRVAEVVGRVRPDWVFHLAAHGAYSNQTDYERITAVNVLGTLNLLNAVNIADGCAGFVHTGSSSEYGHKDHAPTEDEPVAPGSVYAITKCAATHAVSHWARAHNLPAATVRLYSVFGYWEEPTRLLPRLVAHGLAGTLPPLTAPATARDFVWIDDAVDAILRAARRASKYPGAVWNIGTGIQTTLEQLITVARAVFAIQAEPRWNTMAARAWDTDCWLANPARAREQLDWEAATTIDTGLRLMATSREEP